MKAINPIQWTNGETVSSYRRIYGWTQEQLGTLAGIHELTIIRIEKNQTNPSYVALAKLANTFNVEIGHLTNPKTYQQTIMRLDGDKFVFASSPDELPTAQVVQVETLDLDQLAQVVQEQPAAQVVQEQPAPTDETIETWAGTMQCSCGLILHRLKIKGFLDLSMYTASSKDAELAVTLNCSNHDTYNIGREQFTWASHDGIGTASTSPANTTTTKRSRKK